MLQITRDDVSANGISSHEVGRYVTTKEAWREARALADEYAAETDGTDWERSVRLALDGDGYEVTTYNASGLPLGFVGFYIRA